MWNEVHEQGEIRHIAGSASAVFRRCRAALGFHGTALLQILGYMEIRLCLSQVGIIVGLAVINAAHVLGGGYELPASRRCLSESETNTQRGSSTHVAIERKKDLSMTTFTGDDKCADAEAEVNWPKKVAWEDHAFKTH